MAEPDSRNHDEPSIALAAKLLGEYLELHVGAPDYQQHCLWFWAWLIASRIDSSEVLEGDDMARAALVDRYLLEQREDPEAFRHKVGGVFDVLRRAKAGPVA
jgi:hypothetical protein